MRGNVRLLPAADTVSFKSRTGTWVIWRRRSGDVWREPKPLSQSECGLFKDRETIFIIDGTGEDEEGAISSEDV